MAELTERRLLEEAGEISFARGEDYVKYVVGLRVEGSRAKATIQAKNVYRVELDWARTDIRCSCTCPFFDQGFFCKHLVAVGLAAIDEAGEVEPAPTPGALTTAELVAVLDDAEVRSRLVDLVEQDPGVRRALELRAAAKTGDVSALAEELDAMVKQALSFRGFIDYRRSFGVARDADLMLDELETYLDAGTADALLPALLRAVTRLRKVVLQGDDSAGVLGNACQRAAELYARACREGHPDRKKLARWLVRFRESSPGWPQLELGDFVAAFDDTALAVYRREVSKLDERQAGQDRWQRFEADRMLLELADHDGDVDRAIELLSDGEHTSYGAIIERLRAAARDDEAVGWIDRAVAAGRVSGHATANEFWLDPKEIARTYLAINRTDDAIAVLRADFTQRADLASFRQLLDVAEECGRREAERSWALEKALELASRPYGDGALLVDIALADGDLETAWSAARELGAGHKWRALADASKDYAPREAAALYRADVEKDLQYADTSKYADIARRLAAMQDLFARAEAKEEFDAYLAELRETYRRRRSLMSALERQGL
jgi:uncharacterized Zn finger protein